MDGLVDGQTERMPVDEVDESAGARQDVERAVDGHRHHRQLQLVSQCERPFAEDSHMACKRTGALWEHRHTITLLQDISRCVVGLLDLLGAALIDENLVRLTAGIADKRDAAQLVLHHPLEVTSQMTIDKEDVEDALMVCHEHITATFLQLLAPLYLHGYQQRPEDDLRPPPSRIIPPEVAVADSCADAYFQGRDDRHNHHHRQSHKYLIDSV